ncbi:dethiobiotin synthase [Oceanicoccus sagamiensis]|uniref:ATP-dependent dethiobiotin synthetase BioD n=1 Tax=Oceanicoccus sagamiensis TaxID=716816 RepID=A0A1X9NFC3_9GAMM|nr:dethiobiotin synthase [Oceanicoccus sagamiensis]ARN74229.1 dethiobiotin synthase [Oceanicoccus sagamiensis]
MGHRFFIAGTDTDVGKTVIATGILAAANTLGLSTVAIKPVAAGCEPTPEGLRNEDALLLQQAMSLELPYEQINPVALEPAIAPHIAAQQIGKRLVVSQLAGYCRGVLMQRSDFAVIEGAGGWRVPLNSVETLAGLAKALNLPVILVVGVKLGCINHALLTAEAIANDGLPLAGWVANRLDADMPCYEENILTLKSLIRAPCLGEVPVLENPTAEAVSQYLSLDSVITP